MSVLDRRYRRRWIGLGILAAVLLGLRGWLMSEDDWPPRLVLRTGGVSWAQADRMTGPGRKVSVPAAFTPDGALLAVAGPGEVTVWDTAGGRKTAAWTMPGGRSVYQGRFSPDGRTFAAVSWDGKADNLTVDLVDVAAGRVRTSSPAPGVGIVRGGLAFMDGGRGLRVLVVDARNAVHVADLDLDSGQVVADRTLGRQVFHNSTHVAPDGRLLAFAPPTGPDTGPGPELLLWDLDQEREVGRVTGDQRVEASGLSDDGRTLAIARPGGAIEIRDRGETSPRALCYPHSLAVHPAVLELSPDGRTLASSGYRGAASLAQALVIAGLSVVGGSRAASEGELVVAESATGHIQLRTMKEGAPCFSPDGRFLATLHEDGTIRIRELRSGR